MTMTDLAYGSAAVGIVLQIATLGVLGWLYSRTQVKPVLFYLGWQVFSLVWSFIAPGLSARALMGNYGHPPVYPVALFALNQLFAIVHTGLLVWMLVTVAQWGHSSLFISRKTIAPDPAA